MDRKVAIVTGASRGLGCAIAEALAEAGADITIVARNCADLARVERRIQSIGRDCLPIAVDLTQEGAPDQIVSKVLKWKGRIDILFNNAGTNIGAPAEKYSASDWKKVTQLNLDSTFFLSQAVGRKMIKKRSGKIINIGSINSILGHPTVVAYAASKGGVALMTKVLAVEWAKYNVQVNCIIPGWFRTLMTESLQHDKSLYNFYSSRIPMGRWGSPMDLAGASVFLASSASDYVTGILLPVDGGYLSR